MQFSLFYEKFAQGVKTPYGYSEVYVNPDWSDRNEMSDAGGESFRAILAPNDDLYVWPDTAALHEDVLAELGLSHDYNAIPLYIYPNNKNHNVVVSYWTRQSITPEEKEKHNQRILNNKSLQSFLDVPIKMKLVEDQEITSAKTSRPIVASLHNYLMKKGIYQDGMVVLDWGGGKYDKAKDFVTSQKKIKFFVHDLYNRTPEHNLEVENQINALRGADIITITNVLNVIKDPKDRLDTLKKAKRLLKDNGTVYIQIYEAPRSDKYKEEGGIVGQETSDGWQNAQPASFYIPEIKKVFKNIKQIGSYIEAEK